VKSRRQEQEAGGRSRKQEASRTRLLPASCSCLLLPNYLRLFLSLLLTLAFVSTSCIFPRRKPNLERIFAEARARTGKRPLILIPGVLGSQLVNEKTGEVVWPSAFRSSDDGLSLPVSPDLARNRDNLSARKIIDTARLAKLAPEVYIYHALLVALKDYGGYKEGDWNNPGADGDHDTFYVFPYDWRRDNVETARLLIESIEALKRKLNRPDLRFNILAHSMGGLVARYAAMYGGAELQPDGAQPQPTWAGAVHINRIVMLGTPNEGSADAFATLLKGYSVTEGLRRRIPLLNKLSSEDIFTGPAVFQLLPDRAATRFLDENLQPIEIDLYDPAVWRRYGWSPVNDADYRRRFVKGQTRGDDAPFHAGTLADLDAYFVLVLNRARRFHEALDVSVEDAPVQLFALGGDCEDTLTAPILIFDQKRQRWETLLRPRAFHTSTGKRVTLKEAADAMSAPGDGRVTRRSLLGEDLAGARYRNSLFNTTLPIVYAVFACDLHGQLQSNKTLQDNALTALVNEVVK
jgi:pimeloyl-ACP methyl ester carboxylesterase